MFHFPSKGANAFSMFVELPIGTSLQATADKMNAFEAIIDNLPEGEVESHSLHAGESGEHGSIQSEHVATLSVNLTPFGTRDRSADEIVEDVRQKAKSIDGVENYYFGINVGAGPTGGKPVQLMVIGSDDRLRVQLVEEITAFLNALDGVKDVERDDKAGKEEVNIDLDYERLARYGLTVADIAQNVRIAYDGQEVTSVRYGEEDVEFRVILEAKYRQNIQYLRQLRIPNVQGELIALDEIASLNIGPGTSLFNHYDGERATMITGDISQDVTTSLTVTKAVMETFQPRLSNEFPGLRLKAGGEAQESERAMIDLMTKLLLAILGIYFLLILLFNSWSQPFMVILAIPFGLCGVIIAFVLHNEPLGFLSMLGIIGMSGVVVNDSLVLVDHINDLKRRAASRQPKTNYGNS